MGLKKLFENVIMFFAKGQIQEAHDKIRNDPKLAKNFENIEKANKKLADDLNNSSAVDEWYKNNK